MSTKGLDPEYDRIRAETKAWMLDVPQAADTGDGLREKPAARTRSGTTTIASFPVE